MPFIIPHIFKAGEKAIAEQINENFNYLKQSLEQVNTLLNNKIETNVQDINEGITQLNSDTKAISDIIDDRDTILKFGTVVIPDPTEDGQIPTVEIELVADKVHTAAIFANSQIILPTLENDTKYYNCLFEFTIAQDVTLTLPENIKWIRKLLPDIVADGLSVNRLLFDTTDGGANWIGHFSVDGE